METRIPYTLPAGFRLPRGVLWLAFSVHTPATVARAAFVNRYGYEPAEVKAGLGIILAGPVKETTQP
jgi:hypothetical protein